MTESELDHDPALECMLHYDMDDFPPEQALMTVAQIARLAGITVRTLHHYDRIGLLIPSARSDAEYRLYSPADVTRLREVLVWRRLGVPLARIARLLDDPAVDRREVLRRQREIVSTQMNELRDLAAALDLALDQHDEEAPSMSTDRKIVEALGGFDPDDYADEVSEQWGATSAYRESTRRSSTYTPDTWQRIKAEGDAITSHLIELFEADVDATSDDAIEQAEAFRAHVSRWFYKCPPEFLRELGDMYVADPRFRASYEGSAAERPGMAEWVRAVWHARADRG